MGLFLRQRLANTQTVLLLVVLLLGFSLRFVSLSTVPLGFFCDEAAIGVDAYSLLHTGRDQYGKLFPIFFQSLGDYRPPIAIYATVPFVFLFGLNEASVRMQSVLFGMVTIIAVYFLSKELYSQTLGLWAAFIAALIPWLVHYNRTGFEFSSYAALFTLALYFFVKATKKAFSTFTFFTLFALTLYTYQPARLIVPLTLLGLLILYRKIFLNQKRELLDGVLVFILLSFPLFVSFFNGTGLARFSVVSFFNLHLTPLEIVAKIFGNYITLLSPSFFLRGEGGFLTRHFINGLIPILPVMFPFLLVGIAEVLITIRFQRSRLLLWWLLIYPVAGAVVAGSPFTSRAIIGAPLLAIFTAIGIERCIKWGQAICHKDILTAITVCLLLVGLTRFTDFYFTAYPFNSVNFWGWQYGPGEIIQYFMAQRNNYDDLVMYPSFNAPAIFFKFYAPNNCDKCIIGTPHETFSPYRKQLFAIPTDYLPKHPYTQFKTKKYIYYPNGERAFLIGEVVK